MRRTAIAVVALSIWFCSAQTALAAFHRGDVIVSTIVNHSFDPFTPPSFTGTIRQFAPDGSLISQFFSQENDGAADLKFSPQGVLHGAAGANVLRFARDGSALSPLVAPQLYAMKSLAFARSGVLFATTQDGTVLKFGSDGSFQGVVSAQSNAPTWADLSIDQCILYSLTAQIRRLDVCGSVPMTPLTPQLANFGKTLLVLRDGTLLASTSLSDMYRVRPDGSIMRHYTTHAVAFARDLSPDFVWVSVGAQFAKFDLENDLIASGPFNPGSGAIFGIAVVDADVQSIPELSAGVLVLLALSVMALALGRLRY